MGNILLVTLEYPPNSGGVGHYYHSLVEHLPPGSVTVYAPPKKFFWRVWPRWGKLVVDLIKILRREHYDWIAIGQILPIGTAAVVATALARFYKLQAILKISRRETSYKLVAFSHGMDVAQLRGRKRSLARWIFRRCDVVIANSQWTRRTLLALGVKEERIHVLTPCPATARSRPNLQPTTYNLQPRSILSVGRLVARKGFDNVIRVYAKLREQNPTLELKIIGDGPDRARLEGIARELGLEPTEIFLGTMEPDQIASWYDRASVFLLLPREEGNGDVEGFGMVFLEANAHGVPVVAGASGGVSEAVIDGQTGYLVDPIDVDVAASRVRALLSNESLRARLGQQGRKRVEQDFQWQDRARTLLSLLNSEMSLRAERSNPDQEGDRHAPPIAIGGARDDGGKSISIIIPVYNHAKELSLCIASLRAQTLPPREVIVVDDGSTDGSADVAEKEKQYSGPWQRFEVIRESNQGAPTARNRGFAASQGSLVLFSDADIEWKPDALEKLSYALKQHPDASYAYSSFHFGWKLFRSGPFDPERLKRVNYIHTSALIRREHFPGFDPALKKFQDWDLWLTMMEQGHPGVWVDEPLFRIQPRRSGMSHWYPSFMYKIPWQQFGIRIPEVERYKQAEQIIRKKHRL